jgi:hypothetical protein
MSQIFKTIPTLEALNQMGIAWEVYQMEQKGQPYPFGKSRPVWQSKMVGRKVEQQISPVSGVPVDVLVTRGTKQPKFNTNNYTKLLCLFFEAMYESTQARRISSEGKWRPIKGHPEGGVFIPGDNKGLEDIQATFAGGRMLSVEVKGPNDRLRPEQAARKAARGEWYIIATPDWELFCKQVENVLGPPTNLAFIDYFTSPC